MKEQKVLVELNADLKFVYEVDMTEFNQKVMKVDEVEKERWEYIKSKVPDKNIKGIFDNVQEKIEKDGFECVKHIVGIREPNLQCMLKDMLLNGLTPPPQH